MRKTIAIFAATVIAVLTLAAPAAAQVDQRSIRTKPVTALSAVPLDGSGASLVFTIANGTGGATAPDSMYTYAVFYVIFDGSGSATDWSLTCTSSVDDLTTDYTIPLCEVQANGECEVETAGVIRRTTGTSENTGPHLLSIIGAPDLECTAAGAGATASDLISVTYFLMTL